MPWFRVDDQLHTHPKGDEAGDAALGLWVRAGSYCMAYKTNGHVPLSWVRRQQQGAKKAAALVAAHLWETTTDGYLFHDWDDIQETAEQIEAKREKARKRTRDWRDRMAGVDRSGDASRDGVRDASRDGAVTLPSSYSTSTTSSHGSSSPVSEGGSTTATREQPPRKCPKHINDPDPPSCGSCAEARRAHDEWTPPIKPVVWSNCDEHGSHEGHICGACRSEMLTGERPWRAGYRQIGESA